MKISFVIPAYNEEAYLHDCLASIVRQMPGHDAEVIVVNNASTDLTGEIARSFPGITVIDEPRKGLSQARHTGYEASDGDLIANVDADNRLPDGWISNALSAFQKNNNLAVYSGPLEYYDMSAMINVLVKIYYSLAWVLARVGPMAQGGNFIVRRSALKKIGGYNTAFDFYGEDTDIARRMSKVGDVVFSLKLPMKSSGRRFKKDKIVLPFRYLINYLSTLATGRAITKKYNDVR